VGQGAISGGVRAEGGRVVIGGSLGGLVVAGFGEDHTAPGLYGERPAQAGALPGGDGTLARSGNAAANRPTKADTAAPVATRAGGTLISAANPARAAATVSETAIGGTPMLAVSREPASRSSRRPHAWRTEHSVLLATETARA